MNHFLTALLDRTEGRAQVLQPRPRALFEPEGPASMRSFEPTERNDIQVHPREVPHVARSDDMGAPRPPMRGERPPHLDHDRHVAITMERAPTLALRNEDESTHRGALLPNAPAPSVRARLAPVGAVDPIPVRPSPREPAVERQESPTRIVEDSRQQERRPAAAPSPVIEQRPPAQRAPRPAAAPPAMMQTTTIVERSPASPPAPQYRDTSVAPRPAVLLAKAQTSALIRRERAAPSPPAPVQITIGRVEVRAVTAQPARARASGPAVPRLSLDDYLRQRNGDAR